MKPKRPHRGRLDQPEITTLDHYPLNVNDRDASKRVVDAFRGHFGAERVRETGPAPASEDFGSFGAEWHVPSVFWFVGGTDPETYAKAKAANKLNELPVNHSPKFAPVLHPTLQTGVESLVVATRAWLPSSSRIGDVTSRTSGIMEKLPLVLDLMGTFVFALSGALAGVKRELDLFGVLVLSFAAANSGGITRDVLIGAVPPGGGQRLALSRRVALCWRDHILLLILDRADVEPGPFIRRRRISHYSPSLVHQKHLLTD